MKKNIIGLILIVLFFSVGVFSQTTEFTYQGDLQNSSAPANGSFDFEFLLFNTTGAQTGPTLTRGPVTVTNGIFSVKLDFGFQFTGSERFLEIRVKQTGGGAFTTLAPRQAVTSAPYSITSLNAGTASTAGNVTGVVGIANGGTGSNTNPSPDKFLRGDGTAWIASRLDPADIPEGSTSYIQNLPGVGTQTASFNISGGGNANILNAATQYNIGGSRFLSVSGNSMFAGLNAGNLATPGGLNTFFGFHSGNANTGNSNAFFGSSTGISNSGFYNAFFGAGAGQSNTSGSGNSIFGDVAGQLNTEGSDNSFFGASAGRYSTGGSNSFFGSGAGDNGSTGSENTLLGYEADMSSSTLTNATAIGANVIVSQSNSLVLGNNAKVGIGTSEPAAWLDVVSPSPDGVVNTAMFKAPNIGPNISHVHFGAAGDWYIRSAAITGKVVLQDAGGNVGIGTTNPQTKLQVAGGSVYIQSPNSLVITSPNGACWFITVNNAGVLSTISVACP